MIDPMKVDKYVSTSIQFEKQELEAFRARKRRHFHAPDHGSKLTKPAASKIFCILSSVLFASSMPRAPEEAWF